MSTNCSTVYLQLPYNVTEMPRMWPLSGRMLLKLWESMLFTSKYTSRVANNSSWSITSVLFVQQAANQTYCVGIFSTKGVHIIKYLLTQIPCCILICVMLCKILTAVQITCFILYCNILPYIHVINCSTSLYYKGSMECK